ncbi:sugar ABC transporter substrate-binding protein [Microbacterium gorillae]|uniref:sugar ABC transporter substrate-binding protein n=1 Tax=Microbacterium gorillae TaxID=1231063 RepID=UPI00058EEA64|nr:sugar ABC transporter substrate-binding protein [Microbacterium gorillae]
MKKKRFLPIIGLSVAALALTSCSGGSGSASGSDDKADNSGETLKVWIMEGTNPDSSAFFDEVSDAFTEKTGAKLDVEFVQWADAHDRFVTSIAGGTTPDVAETGNTWTAEFADAGGLLPITDYIKKSGLEDDLVEGLKASGELDGEQYGMPWYAGVRALIYRADIFKELGLEAPQNWDDIVTAGEAIKKAHPEMIPFAVPGDAEMSVYPWVWGAGGEVATEKDGTWTSELDSAKSVEGLEFITGLATEKGFSSAGATTWKETDVLDNFSQGKVAMALQGSWTPATIKANAPEMADKLAATTIPAKDGGIAKSVLGGSHLSIFANTKKADLAWDFVELMSTGEFAEKWAEQSGYFSGQKSLVEKTIQSTDPLVAPFAKQFVEGGAALPVTPQFGAVQAKKTTPAMMQSILSGQKDVKTAAKDAAAEMTDLLNKK